MIRITLLPWETILQNDQKDSLTKNQLQNKLKGTSPYSDKPNVYHFIFDRATGDHYRSFIERNKNKLKGYVYYPRATTPYGFTIGALAAIARGRMPQEGETLCHYIHSEDESNYFKSFREQQYQIFSHHYLKQVSSTKYHESQLILDMPWPQSFMIKSNDVIHQLLMVYFPKLNSRVHFRNANSLNMIKGLSALEKSLYYFKSEEAPRTGMYYLFYLAFPHPPYVFDSSCEFKLGGTSDKEHRRCFERIITNIFETLSEIHLNKKYYVVINSDHGESSSRVNPFILTNVFSDPEERLLVSPSPVSLVDLVPSLHSTILKTRLSSLDVEREFPHKDAHSSFFRDDYYLVKNFDCRGEVRHFKINTNVLNRIPDE